MPKQPSVDPHLDARAPSARARIDEMRALIRSGEVERPPVMRQLAAKIG